MALMCLFPLSGEYVASFPHVLKLSCRPPVPKPIRESQEPQWFCSLAVMPILALELRGSPTALNPSLLQLGYKEAREPISDFHVLRPSEVARYFPSAISENNELACLLMTVNLSRWPIFIRGRSWRRMCSSRLVTWSLGNQSQSCLQQSYRHFCCSRIGNRNGKFSERQELLFWFTYVHFSNIESFAKETGS